MSLDIKTNAPRQVAARHEVRHEVRIGFPVSYAASVMHSRLAWAEAAIVRTGLPLISQWRRGWRFTYQPGHLTQINPNLVKV